MPVEFWAGGEFETPHERIDYEILRKALYKRFDHSPKNVFVASCVFLNGREFDVIVFKSDAIIIADLKSCNKPIKAVENGNWPFLTGGTFYMNPFRQVQGQRYALMEALNERATDFLRPQKASNSDFEHIHCVVAITPVLHPDSQNAIDPKQRWFHLSGADQFPQLVDQITSKRFSFTADELRTLLGSVFNCEMEARPEPMESEQIRSTSRTGNESGAEAREENPIDLSSYYRSLALHYDSLHLGSLFGAAQGSPRQIRVRELFIPRTLRDLPLQKSASRHALEESPANEPLQAASSVFADERYSRMVLLGDAGSGKSTLIAHYVMSLLPERNIGARTFGTLPMVVELRRFSVLSARRRCDTFLEYLQYVAKIEHWHLEMSDLDLLLRRFRCVIVFEALDEIRDLDLRNQVQHQIVSFATEYPSTRILVTSRYSTYERGLLQNSGFHHFVLGQLESQDIYKFIDRYCLLMSDAAPDVLLNASRLKGTLQQSERTLDLVSNPLLLSLTILLYSSPQPELSRVRILEKGIDLLIEKWTMGKHVEIKDAGFQLLIHHKRQLLREIAVYLRGEKFEKFAAIQIAGQADDLISVLARFLRDQLAIDYTASIVQAREVIDDLENVAGILKRIEADTYSFSHELFADYCVASYIVEKHQNSSTGRDDLRGLFLEKWRHPEWSEVLRLVCGMVDGPTGLELVENLAFQIQPLHYPIPQLPPWNLVLAVQCLGELALERIPIELGRRVLRSILDLVDRTEQAYSQSRNATVMRTFIWALLSAAVDSVGDRWPKSDLILIEWLATRSREAMLISDLLNDINGKRIKNPPETLTWFVGKIGRKSTLLRAYLLGLAETAVPSARALAPRSLAVGWSDDPQVFTVIAGLASSDTDPAVRMQALRGLAWLSSSDHVFACIVAAAQNDEIHEVREYAAWLVWLAYPDHPQVRTILRHSLNDGSPGVRAEAIRGLTPWISDDESVTHLVRQLAAEDSSSIVRSVAIRCLGDRLRGDKEIESVLYERSVIDASPYVRLEALDELIHRFPSHSANALSEVQSLFQYGPAGVRYWATQILLEQTADDLERGQMFRICLEDSDAFVRAGVLDEVKSLRSVPSTLLRQTLEERIRNDGDAMVRIAAISRLYEYYSHDPSIQEILCQCAASDENQMVRAAALTCLVLAFASAPSTFQTLVQCLTDTPPKQFRRYAAEYAVRALVLERFRDANTRSLIQAAAFPADWGEHDWPLIEVFVESGLADSDETPKKLVSIVNNSRTARESFVPFPEISRADGKVSLDDVLRKNLHDRPLYFYKSDELTAIELLIKYFPEGWDLTLALMFSAGGSLDAQDRSRLIAMMFIRARRADQRASLCATVKATTYAEEFSWWLRACSTNILPLMDWR